jgi:20S proteasome subunit beta 5
MDLGGPQTPVFYPNVVERPRAPLVEEETRNNDLWGLPVAKRPTPPLEFAHGTTTLSFSFQGGIVAAVDSRASLGNFVGSKTTQKVLPINSHVLGTMAGGAADCSYWIRKLSAEAKLHELTEGRRMSVARASRLLSDALYANRGYGLSVGTMIMGFDDDGSGKPKIYYVDDTGMRIEGDMFSVGSGSTFAYGILDTERRYDMTTDEAVALGIKAIRHAIFRDAFSGGFINVYLITPDGWKRVFTEDLDVARERRPEDPEVEKL